MRKTVCFLVVIIAALMVRMLLLSLDVYDGRIPQMPKLAGFNNLSMFKLCDGSDRVYEVVDEINRPEGSLRFAFVDIDPSLLSLRIVVKARGELLRSAKIRSARSSWGGGVINGDVATFDISMRDVDTFMWNDGKCYVGISFPRSVLKAGDTVELVDAKFSLR